MVIQTVLVKLLIINPYININNLLIKMISIKK